MYMYKCTLMRDAPSALLLRHRDGWGRLTCRCPVVNLCVPGDTYSGVTRDTPGVSVAQSLRPGNFKNVIPNMLYPFAMSDTRCSVSNTDRPPRYLYLPGSAGAQKSGGVGSPAHRCAAPDARNFEGPRAAE